MSSKQLKALSIRQPWAWLIASGYKGVENRCWKYDPSLRGRIAIHAAKGCTKAEYADAVEFAESIVPGIKVPPLDELDRGGIVATADLIGITRDSDDPWYMGELGLILRNVEKTAFQPCKGQLGFFDVEIEL